MVKILSTIVSKGDKQAKEAEQQAKQTRAEIDALQSHSHSPVATICRKKSEKRLRHSKPCPTAVIVRCEALNDWVKTTGARGIFMSTEPLRVRWTCSDMPTDFWWRELRPEETDVQLQNRVEECYLYKQGDKLVIDESVSDLSKLGGTADDIKKLRERVEAAIPVPKRLKSPAWQR